MWSSSARCFRGLGCPMSRPGEFRRYGSARQLYNFHVDNLGSY